jgi:AcrR family transcriptional regulator
MRARSSVGSRTSTPYVSRAAESAGARAARFVLRAIVMIRRPLQARAKEKVRAILDAAETLLHQTSPDELVMRDVARRAAVAPATLYDYFPTKELLLDALEDRAAGAIAELVAAPVGDAERASLGAELAALTRDPLRLSVATDAVALLSVGAARDRAYAREVGRLVARYLVNDTPRARRGSSPPR